MIVALYQTFEFFHQGFKCLCLISRSRLLIIAIHTTIMFQIILIIKIIKDYRPVQ